MTSQFRCGHRENQNSLCYVPSFTSCPIVRWQMGSWTNLCLSDFFFQWAEPWFRFQGVPLTIPDKLLIWNRQGLDSLEPLVNLSICLFDLLWGGPMWLHIFFDLHAYCSVSDFSVCSKAQSWVLICIHGLHNPRLTRLAVLLIHGRPRSMFPGHVFRSDD